MREGWGGQWMGGYVEMEELLKDYNDQTFSTSSSALNGTVPTSPAKQNRTESVHVKHRGRRRTMDRRGRRRARTAATRGMAIEAGRRVFHQKTPLQAGRRVRQTPDTARQTWRNFRSCCSTRGDNPVQTSRTTGPYRK